MPPTYSSRKVFFPIIALGLVMFLSSLSFGQGYSIQIGALNFGSGTVAPASCAQDGSFFFVVGSGWQTCVSGVYVSLGGGTGTVTNTGGNLTANSIVLGAGTVDTKVLAGFTTNGTAELDIGAAGTGSGVLGLKGRRALPAVRGRSRSTLPQPRLLPTLAWFLAALPVQQPQFLLRLRMQT